MKIGILLYDGVDLLDLGGPYEVFLTASRLVERGGEVGPFEVETFSVDGSTITAYGGLSLGPSHSADNIGPLDVLVVPGTTDLTDPLADKDLSAAISTIWNQQALVASVCTGAFLLAEAGVLTEQNWTTHWEDIDALTSRLGGSGHGGATRDVRWVDAGRVVTAGGLSSGIAMALHLVDRLTSRELAIKTAKQLDYDWDPHGGTS